MASERSTAAFQGFLVDAKQYWMSEVWGELKDDYRRRSAGKKVSSSSEVAKLMDQSPTYWFYSWLERHIQRAKYSGRYGLEKMPAQKTQPARPPKLRDVRVPEYYSQVDTHQHPGNLHGAPNAGLVYKASAQSTQPGATNRYGLHERFARFVGELGEFKNILEMGCGFGKSALPLAQRFSRAQVKAIDISAPCLQLAAAEADAAKVGNIDYEQADLRHTGYRDGEFDLVTSTMVLHELDTPALRESLHEAHRVLARGGTLVHLDFRVKDPFLEFIHYGHARRNNEPYMPEINELDLEGEMRKAGFADVKTLPFEEVDGATRPDWPTWRFPWTAFVARKP